MGKLKRVARISFDAIVLVAISGVALTVPYWLESNRRGFFCGDESLQYPYRESTIGTVELVVTTLSVPGFIILVLELLRTLDGVASSGNHGQQQQRKAGYRLGQRLLRCLSHWGYYLFGMALTILATQTAKTSVGRLRPHFFAACQPQLPDGSSCAQAENHGRYIEQYHCAAPNATSFTLEQVSQSFPSAHASTYCYAMLYAAIYVQQAMSTRFSKLFKHLLQFGLVLYAWYVSLTRITDFYHHWSDVLAGGALGLIIAVAVAQFVARLAIVGGRSTNTSSSGSGSGSNQTARPQVKPNASTLASAKTNAGPTAVLPAYTFGSMPYLHHAQSPYAQTYHNYGYVP